MMDLHRECRYYVTCGQGVRGDCTKRKEKCECSGFCNDWEYKE